MLNIVLFQPEIPENTGNIARMCVALNAKLHLIKPYGFFLNSSAVKRSGVDYWNNLQLIEHITYEDFIESIKQKEYDIFFLTRHGKKNPSEIKFDLKKETYLVFGKESSGIDKNILKDNIEKTIRMPISNNVRSINLANTVAIFGYLYVMQNNYEGLEINEPFKKNFLEE